MAITITQTRMHSDRTAESAAWEGQAQAWRLSWLPGAWTRAQATSAMLLAGHQAAGDTASRLVTSLRAELGI